MTLNVRSRWRTFFVPVTAGMNGFLKAEFSNMWTATLQNKKSFKRPISKFVFFSFVLFFLNVPSFRTNLRQLYFISGFSSGSVKFWPSPCHLFLFFQRSLCWGKDEGFGTKQEDCCCAAEKCWSVSIFLFFPLHTLHFENNALSTLAHVRMQSPMWFLRITLSPNFFFSVPGK